MSSSAVDLNSVKSMKAWLCKNNVKHSDCKDKESLADRVQEAQAKQAGKPYESKRSAAAEEAAPKAESKADAKTETKAETKVEAVATDGAEKSAGGVDDDDDEDAAKVPERLPYDMATLLAALRAQAPAKRPERKQSEIEAPPPELSTVLLGGGKHATNKHAMVCRFCDTKLLLKGVAKLAHDQEIFLHSMTIKDDQSKGDVLSEFWVVEKHTKFENLSVTKPQIMAHIKQAPAKAAAAAGAGAGAEAAAADAKSESSGSGGSGAGSDGKEATTAAAAASPEIDIRPREYKYLACGSCDRGPFGITFADDPKRWFVAHARVKYI